MNIITTADVEKFLKLAKVGFKNGKKKELKNYTSATTYEGTSVAKEYYVSIEFSFVVDRETMDEVFIDESFDVSKKVDDLLK